MNDDRRMKRLQQKQAKKKYKEYKKRKHSKKFLGSLVLIVGFLILGVMLVYLRSTKEEIQEEIIVQQEGQLTIEKVGEELKTEEVLEASDDQQEVGEISEEENVEKVEAYLSTMNLEARVAQLFMITPEELTGVGIVVQAGSTTQSKLKEYPVGGLIFSSQNVEVVSQVKLMLNSIESYTSTPIFLVMDADGAVRITNTNNSLVAVGFDMAFDESLYLLQGEEWQAVDTELDVVLVDEEIDSIVDLVINGAEVLIVTDDFTELYEELLTAARNGELETSVLEERVRAILTYKVENGI